MFLHAIYKAFIENLDHYDFNEDQELLASDLMYRQMMSGEKNLKAMAL